MLKQAITHITSSGFRPQQIWSVKTLTLAFVVTMLALLGNTFVLYNNMEIVKEHQRQITRTNEFIEELEVTLSLLKDIETGQRGYAIAEKESFLDPYYQGIQTIFSHIRRMKDIKRDDPQLLDRLATLEAKTKEAIAFHERIVALVYAGQAEQGRKEVSLGKGKLVMDGIRALCSEIKTTEKKYLQARDVEAAMSAERIDRVFLFAVLSSLILGTLTYLLILRNFTQQAKNNEHLSRESWIKTGVAELSESLRGALSVEKLSERTLDFFSRYTNAQAGRFYVLKGQRLELTGTLAPLRSERNLHETIEIGQTLAGDSFRQKRMLRVNGLPGDYMRIGSSLGESQVRDLVLMPLLFEDEPVGVIELGRFADFDDLTLEIFDITRQSIGVSLSAAQSRSALQELLEETQRQAEELQAQQEELRVSNEELENQTSILQSSKDMLLQQQEELRQINEELEQQAVALEAQSGLLNARNQALEDTKSELLAKADALENASRYKSEFLANMSHELRTPLNSLLILSTLLSENKDGNLSAKQVDFARTIYKSGNDLLALINDILDLSKVEAGKLSLQPEDIEVRVMLEDLAREFEHQAKDKNIGFRVEMAKDGPATIWSDKQRVEQILKNLLSNAIKFTSQGSVQLNLRYDPSQVLPVMISVVDTGIGIPRDKQQLIFDAFEQVDRSTSRAYGGTGLGLTISRELASLLGAEIRLESSPGRGSQFTLLLPLAIPKSFPVHEEAHRENSTPAAGLKPSLAAPSSEFERITPSPAPPVADRMEQGSRDTAGRRLILIVEDDVDFGNSLIEVAREAGFEAALVTSGEGALEFVAQNPVKAILLDIKLPDVSGFGVMERIKAHPATRHIPIHVISGVDHSKSALNLGAVGYLLKPAAKSQLEEVFHNLEDIISRQVKKVLVVEDDAIQREAVEMLLAGNDIELVTASSAKEALEKLAAISFDCMILDLHLPDLSGFELLERMESSDIVCRPPVIVYTGKDLTQSEIESLQKYSDSIVIKGVRSPERLLDEVSLFLHRVETQLPPDSRAILTKLRRTDDPLTDRKILLVDDDMRNVFAMANALNTHGLKIVVAKQGQEALDRLDQDPGIELVLMDIMMPIMDGYEAMTRIRAQARFKRLPIIALTAKAMKGDHEKCLKAGANDYLPKPVNLERLLTLIKVWLPRRHEV